MRASGHFGRADRCCDRTPLFLHRVFWTRNDQEMPVRGPLKDVVPLVPKVGADAAADVRPALRKVADQALGEQAVRIVSTHALPQHGARDKVPSAVRRPNCRHFLHIRLPALSPKRKNQQFSAISLNWHADCYIISVHLVPRQRKGRCSGFSGPAPPSLFVSGV